MNFAAFLHHCNILIWAGNVNDRTFIYYIFIYVIYENNIYLYIVCSILNVRESMIITLNIYF